MTNQSTRINNSEMSQDSRVSVVIPVYNGQEFIQDAVQSCFRQAYRPIEVLVVNDGSTDATAAKATDLQSSLSSDGFRLRLIDIGRNMGAANALNVGFSEARGEYICWLSADDLFIDDEKTSKQIAQMIRSEADWSYFKNYIAGPTPATARLVKSSYLPKLRMLDSLFIHNPLRRLALLLFINPVNGSSVMIKRNAAMQYGQFDSATRNIDGDGDLWMRYSAQRLKLQALSGATVFYREHGKQTSKKKDQMIYGCELTRMRMIRVLEKTGMLERTIKTLVPFLPILVGAKKHYERPMVSEHLFTYIIGNKSKFNWIVFKISQKSLSEVRNHWNYLNINKDNFERDLESLERSTTFKQFEMRLMEVMEK